MHLTASPADRDSRSRVLPRPRIGLWLPLASLCLTLSAWPSAAAESPGPDVVVYEKVPGLPPSEHYSIRVRPAAGDGRWRSTFAWQTECRAGDRKRHGYFSHLDGWTHTYVNFETAVPVVVEIARVDRAPIRTAAVHPRRKAASCSVEDGRAVIRLDEPCLVAVDIDGQMDGQNTGKGYRGPPIHAVSIFANPPLDAKPAPTDPGVLVVKPGETPPSDGDWTTLFFLPGVHDVGLSFPLRANRHYYIPGDALVHGTLANRTWGDAKGVRIFGLGTLSGSRLEHPQYVRPPLDEPAYVTYRPIDIAGTIDTRVEGITIADSAYHSLMLAHPGDPGHANAVRWAKILTWRTNGDGINPFGNTLVEDCFIRTQDDALYVNGLGIRRTVLWNDANGSAFVLSALPQLPDRRLVVEDCDVIYARAIWDHWSGGRVFNMRGEGGGTAGSGVIFRNITVEDARPTLQHFFVCMSVPPPYSTDGPSRSAGDLAGILFENISLAGPSALGEPELLWGNADARICNLRFKNLTLGGRTILDAEFFRTNEWVKELSFEP